MEWKQIEEFLLNSIWGVVVLGALGSLLFYIVLNLVGRANRNIRRYWIFYRRGREFMFKKCIENDEMFSHLKWSTFYTFQMTIIMLIIVNSVIFSKDFSIILRVIMVLTCIFSGGIACIYSSIIQKAAWERIKNSTKESSKE